MNVATPIIEKYTQPRVFGGAKKWCRMKLLN
jgi:Na+-translocating ferredoxin:NAD+ oxidoreductase RnfD subunit